MSNKLIDQFIRDALDNDYTVFVRDEDTGDWRQGDLFCDIQDMVYEADEAMVSVEHPNNNGGTVWFIHNNGSTLGEDVCDYTINTPFIEELCDKYDMHPRG